MPASISSVRFPCALLILFTLAFTQAVQKSFDRAVVSARFLTISTAVLTSPFILALAALSTSSLNILLPLLSSIIFDFNRCSISFCVLPSLSYSFCISASSFFITALYRASYLSVSGVACDALKIGSPKMSMIVSTSLRTLYTGMPVSCERYLVSL